MVAYVTFLDFKIPSSFFEHPVSSGKQSKDLQLPWYSPAPTVIDGPSFPLHCLKGQRHYVYLRSNLQNNDNKHNNANFESPSLFWSFVNLKYSTGNVFTWLQIALDRYRCRGYFPEMSEKKKRSQRQGSRLTNQRDTLKYPIVSTDRHSVCLKCYDSYQILPTRLRSITSRCSGK